jgi:hypothetical protein
VQQEKTLLVVGLNRDCLAAAHGKETVDAIP